MGYPSVSDRLHTRYSPVRRSPSKYCYFMLPLDLHVLSLSLAFILSQDQTLHTKNFLLLFCSYAQLCSDFIVLTYLDSHLLFVCFSNLFNILKNYIFLLYYLKPTSYSGLLRKADAKIIYFIFTIQIFWNFFFKKISSHNLLKNNLWNTHHIFQYTEELMLFFNTTSQHFHNHTKHHRINLKSGCKSRRIIFLFQTFLWLFSDFFVKKH